MHEHLMYLCVLMCVCVCVCVNMCERIESLSAYSLRRVKQFVNFDLFLGNFHIVGKKCQLKNYKICYALEDYIKLSYDTYINGHLHTHAYG